MQKSLTLVLPPEEAAHEASVRQRIAAETGVPASAISGYHIIRRSLDARSRHPRINLSLLVFIQEPPHPRAAMEFLYQDVHGSCGQVLIAGAGPAGLFAALRLLQQGIRPVIVERGKNVRARRHDLARMNKQGLVDPDSNYCYGEGGAGTYSDGKLYTRSHKRGDVDRILQLFVHFGADERILYEAHPHIGTNKLPGIITAMRETILHCGGQIRFGTKLTDLVIKAGQFHGIQTESGDRIEGDALILATGHSARDVFQMLHRGNIRIEAKPFALGVRVEHPQSLIDQVQYHLPRYGPAAARPLTLPPASYNWVEQVDGKGVFSFCMCPGGIIAPAATAPGEIVVNGWSPSKRNNPYANSGIVVSIDAGDWRAFEPHGPLAAMQFQMDVEQKAFTAGGGSLVAPAQRLMDFIEGRNSDSLPACSYLPGIRSNPLRDVLPALVSDRLRTAFRAYGKKMPAYLTNEAVVVATESRTSSPVRIPRDPKTLQHPGVKGLYPCGEGAGYAGGIVSAAMDGERVADRIAQYWPAGR